MLSTAPTSSTAAMPSTVAPVADILKEYGVIHLRHALSGAEQRELFNMISSDVKTRPPSNPIPANFHLSSGDVGAATRNPRLHEIGELLYARFAQEVASQLSPAEVEAEHALARIARIHSGQQPVRVDHVSGVSYLSHSVLDNHQDGPMPLNTMSVAIGDACDFVVGAKPRRAFGNVRAGEPVSLRMESGDAIFFDGGSVPHAIPKVHKGTAPEFFRAMQAKGFQSARVSVLFREPDGWDAKYLGP